LLCRKLAGEGPLFDAEAEKDQNEQAILIYVRKSEDLTEVIETLQDLISYILKETGREGKGRVHKIFMEKWALRALEESLGGETYGPVRSTLAERLVANYEASNEARKVAFVEWLPDTPDQAITTSFMAPESPPEKTFNNFNFVFCVGGDGTLMRLLRVLYFRCLPPTLPKIVTMSLGSLSYLSNFTPAEV